jgi:hypothetical protein
MKKILIIVAALAMSAAFALTGAPAAQANDDGLCWNGWIWSACIQGPGWVDWNPGWNNWDGDWGHGNKHWNPGHGHWK